MINCDEYCMKNAKFTKNLKRRKKKSTQSEVDVYVQDVLANVLIS